MSRCDAGPNSWYLSERGADTVGGIAALDGARSEVAILQFMSSGTPASLVKTASSFCIRLNIIVVMLN